MFVSSFAYVLQLRGRCIILQGNIRLGCKWKIVPNTLAYYTSVLLKSFELANIIYFFTKHATLMTRSTTLSSPLVSVPSIKLLTLVSWCVCKLLHLCLSIVWKVHNLPRNYLVRVWVKDLIMILQTLLASLQNKLS